MCITEKHIRRCMLKGSNRLMLITNRTPRYTEYDQAKMFYEAGGTWVQLRMKDNLNLETATEIARLRLPDPHCVLCIDDNVDIALKSGAQSVHLGKNDMPVREAWSKIKEYQADGYWVGATANTFEDIEHAISEHASYIGLGPYRYTDTKKNLSPILGLEGYRRVMTQCKEAGYQIPVVAIGGICLEDVVPLLETGVTGIAVSGAIVNAADPMEETRKFLAEIKKVYGNEFNEEY
ncbi:thiamine phosphate synthase [Parabacteroides bouchesdurhonensis]|uniref:thiamine phosphate synthase n=1 Tax=Parabacteroides bouchesdurhonensis TaxID=1936995 RepID=UPI000E4E1D5F|nr:thiamine phosphate synthase [Parabacteroides bouchesdurhonensis]RHJ91377.1 thiamine phosphate synthase [Bacteroides sp. AM07-16]